MSRPRSLQRFAALLTLTAVLVAGCGGSKPAEAPANSAAQAPAAQTGPKVVTVVLGSDPPSLYPNFTGSADTTTVTTNIFDPLFILDRKGEIQPGLATSWENPKPDTWVVNLRKDVTFQNGDKLTAADVVFSIERILDEKNASTQRGTYGFISKVTALDESKVEIVTKGPYPPFLVRMSALLIVPKAEIEKVGVEAFSRKPVGTGAFKLTEWTSGQQLVLEAFDNHWRGRAAVDKVVWRVIPEGTTQIQELRAGGVDLVAGVLPDQIPQLKKESNISIKTTPITRNMMLPIDASKAPLNDVKVRQALNYAVDKEAIITNILNGLGTPLKGILPDMVFGHNPNLKSYPYDPAKAKQLLAEAGYPNGFTVEFKATASRVPNAKQIAEAVRGYWEEIGVKTDFQFYQEITPWLALWPDKVKPLPMSSWGGGFDADFYYFPIVRTGQIYAVHNDPKLDVIIDKARSTTDQNERLKLYHEAEAYMVDQAAWVFLWSQQAAFGISNRLDWEPRVDESIQAFEFKLK